MSAILDFVTKLSSDNNNCSHLSGGDSLDNRLFQKLFTGWSLSVKQILQYADVGRMLDFAEASCL